MFQKDKWELGNIVSYKVHQRSFRGQLISWEIVRVEFLVGEFVFSG